MKFLFFSLYRQFPARAPQLTNSTVFLELAHHTHELEPGLGRSAFMQGCFQMATLVVTVVIAIAGGLVTGNNPNQLK